MFTIQNWELYVKEGLLEDQLKEIERACNIELDRSGDLIHQLWLLNDQVSAQVKPEESCEITNIQYSSATASIPFHDRPIDDYAAVVYLPFEHIQMPVPTNFHHVLSLIYGKEYMTPVKWTASHEYPFYKIRKLHCNRCLMPTV